MLSSSVSDPLEPNAGLHRKTLLVLDDDPVVRRTLCGIADGIGWASISAPSFHDAEFLLESHAFDCIVTDVMVAREDVSEFLRKMAALERRAPVLIIGRGDAPTREAAADLGQSLGLNICYPIEKPIANNSVASRLTRIGSRLCKGIVGCCNDECRWRMLPKTPET